MTELQALLLSIVIEAAVAAALVGALRWGSPLRAAFAASLATLMTHWFAWHGVLWLEAPLGYRAAVLIVESAVVVCESFVYLAIVPLPPRRAFIASLIANAASTAAGLTLYALDLV
jgi:hypothetical protein